MQSVVKVRAYIVVADYVLSAAAENGVEYSAEEKEAPAEGAMQRNSPALQRAMHVVERAFISGFSFSGILPEGAVVARSCASPPLTGIVGGMFWTIRSAFRTSHAI